MDAILKFKGSLSCSKSFVKMEGLDKKIVFSNTESI